MMPGCFRSSRSRLGPNLGLMRLLVAPSSYLDNLSGRRLPGAVVKVINLNSDLLEVESEGFLGKIAVEKTDFWQRAESARKVSKQRENRERELATARQQKENEDRIKAARAKRYENAADLQIEIIQVTEEGCLAIVLG
jgi:hypothetical protein